MLSRVCSGKGGLGKMSRSSLSNRAAALGYPPSKSGEADNPQEDPREGVRVSTLSKSGGSVFSRGFGRLSGAGSLVTISGGGMFGLVSISAISTGGGMSGK